MGIYEQSIQRPFTNIKRLLGGILWNILPILNFVAMGYSLRCAKLSMKNNFEMPSWDKKGELFKNGFFSILIQIIYLLPVIILFFAMFFSNIVNIIKNLFINDKILLGESIILLIKTNIGLFIFITILGILILYITPIAIINFISKNNFNHAFDLPVIFKKAFTGKYFTTFILMSLYSILIYILLSFIPFIGGAISGFIIQVTSYSAYSAIYNKL